MDGLVDIAKLLSDNEANINWRYTGPFDKTKQRVQAGNLLHLAARIQNKGKFVDICKKNIASVTAHNEYGDLSLIHISVCLYKTSSTSRFLSK